MLDEGHNDSLILERTEQFFPVNGKKMGKETMVVLGQ